SQVRDALASGRGLQKFADIIEAQGGDPSVVDHPERLPLASGEHLVRADRSGVFSTCDAGRVGHAAVALGAGRDHVESIVDPGVGIDVLVDVGAHVRAGEPLLRVYFRDERRLAAALPLLTESVGVTDAPAPGLPLFFETIDRTTANGAAHRQDAL
ncbi:MAG: pyrimidine-nucleoside phosphorylase, partial [Acidobacteria bacterium]|nr:pyrimidine-nucleoside phosphorylase [Acidobacteriota bacterium]